jgi:hypothetical protein
MYGGSDPGLETILNPYPMVGDSNYDPGLESILNPSAPNLMVGGRRKKLF